ncbi:transglycosylase SLT domain-containing protein, partial [Fervidobacterium sp.]
QYGLPPTLITALISVESNFSNVKGPGGVLGMMQILPSTAKSISKLLGLEIPKNGWEELLTNYKLNITYGTAYISYLYKKHGTLQKALEEYNNGKNKAKYAELILKQYKYYHELHTTELSKKQSILSQTSVTSVSNATSTDIDALLDTPQPTETVNDSESIFSVLFGVNKDK